MDPEHLRDLIVAPVLHHLGMWSLAAEQLLLGTAAQESKLRYLRQLGGGPALGLWQIEPATERDIWNNYLAFRQDLEARIRDLQSPFQGLAVNLPYGCAMARLVYRRSPLPLPPAGDVAGLAQLWKQVYNTPRGKGTVAEFIESWRLVGHLYPEAK